MLRGLFVTGTDTGVGKTVVSAALLHRHGGEAAPLRYWKPIQTGTRLDDDTAEVRRLTAGVGVEIVDEGVRLAEPVSPHLAAALAGTEIDLAPLVARRTAGPPAGAWIVEGAGGVLVPINRSSLMVDLMGALGLAALVVARSSLGTINHTLLTLACLRGRSVPVAGVVMVGEPDRHNRAAIEDYGRVVVVGEMPRFERVSAAALAGWAPRGLDPDARLGEWLR